MFGTGAKAFSEERELYLAMHSKSYIFSLLLSLTLLNV
jgi:hypothetical protein